MQGGFHNYKTIYDFLHKISPEASGPDPIRFYRKLLLESTRPAMSFMANILADPGVIHNQLVSEYLWVKGDRPYYNVYPSLVPVFAKGRLDIPVNLLKLPHGSSCFCIRLPEENKSLVIDDQHRVQTILFWKLEKEVINKYLKKIQFEFPVHNMIMLWIDVNERESVHGSPFPILTYKTLVWDNDETIEESMCKLQESNSSQLGLKVPEEIVRNCVRLAASVCFLVESGDELIVPDVLAKDRIAYQQAKTKQEKDKFREKAIKAGKFGWNVGVEEMFNSRPTVGVGGELQYAHVRDGHWHTVLYGTNKSQRKIIWYRPTVVRSDLPFRS